MVSATQCLWRRSLLDRWRRGLQEGTDPLSIPLPFLTSSPCLLCWRTSFHSCFFRCVFPIQVGPEGCFSGTMPETPSHNGILKTAEYVLSSACFLLAFLGSSSMQNTSLVDALLNLLPSVWSLKSCYSSCWVSLKKLPSELKRILLLR